MHALEHIGSWNGLRAFFEPHKWCVDEAHCWIVPPGGLHIPVRSMGDLVPALQRLYSRRAQDELTVFAIVDQHVEDGAGDTPQRAWAYGTALTLPPHVAVRIDDESIPPEFLEACATSAAADGRPMDVETMRERVREEIALVEKGQLNALLDGAARLKARAKARL